MNDEKGQLSGEYMLLVGSLIVVLMISIFMIANENELNIAMAAENPVLMKVLHHHQVQYIRRKHLMNMMTWKA